MKINIKIPNIPFTMQDIPWVSVVFLTALVLSIISMSYYYFTDNLIAYGDAESHLNIAKRVVSSITPGMAQLGGIWPPIPHLMMVPFVYFDSWWRSGLAGSIVSGFCFIISCLYLYKLTHLITRNVLASFFSFLVFAFNPNILYMQTTPMTELPLIMFFILSSYYFVKYLKNDADILALIAAAFFGFCASLSRYDGWFLVLFEAAVLMLRYFPHKLPWKQLAGRMVFFGTLAFFGIAIWMIWDYLILGDPFYFTNSQYSAKTQQEAWFLRGQLPAYHNIFQSLAYYIVTGMSNSGIFIYCMAVLGFIAYLIKEKSSQRFLISLILLVPFFFYVITLYIGQSVIFIPSLTPVSFEWRLFNVRYGLMMLPAVAFFLGYLFYRSNSAARLVILLFFFLQFGLYASGYSKIISLEDGTHGLSSAKKVDAQYWMAENYDSGLVLIDDYARSISITRSKIPMQEIIYVGNKPYWEESMRAPEKYATWIVMQKNDSVWTKIYDDPAVQGRLYTYFNKVYTSPEILIFKKKSAAMSYHETN
jgi:hypothetical protein